MEQVVLVDANDRPLGTAAKLPVHFGKGILHRAFSVFVYDDRGRLLVQQRAQGKMLWGGFWSNTCCSHPRPGETVEEAGRRRLVEELGFSCDLTRLGSFRYRARFGDVGTEHEVCHVLQGRYSKAVIPNPDEVSAVDWLPPEIVRDRVKKEPHRWTPWFLVALQRFPQLLGD